MDEFNTLPNGSFCLEVKKSKFIVNNFVVFNESEAKEIIKKIKKEHHKAKHHVYAYYLQNNVSRSSDDGEPQGTAGVQILNVIKQFNLKDMLIIITRYFGGILLGKGRLARTYYSCAKSLIENSRITKKYQTKNVVIDVNHDEYYKILNSKKFNIKSSEFYNKVKVTISIKDSNKSKFRDLICNFLNREVTCHFEE